MKGLQPQLRDEETVHQPDAHGHDGDGEQRGGQRPLLHREQPRQPAADEANHRTDGEVNAACHDHKRHADADDAEERRAADEILDVVAGAEALARPRGEEADGEQEAEDAVDFFHAERRCEPRMHEGHEDGRSKRMPS